jgi:ABC-type uncharacterized transport system auxiliary subunit
MKRGAVVFLALLGGCINLRVPAPEVHDYILDYPPPPAASERQPVIIRLAPLGAGAVYDRQSIVYREGPYVTGAYLHDRWMANPAKMIGDLLARDMAASEVYRAVQHGPSTLPADYEVTGEVESIEERIGQGAGHAHLALRILLARTRTKEGASRVLFQRTYSADVPCETSGPNLLVAAMSRAAADVSFRIQLDLVEAIARDAPGR